MPDTLTAPVPTIDNPLQKQWRDRRPGERGGYHGPERGRIARDRRSALSTRGGSDDRSEQAGNRNGLRVRFIV